MTISVQFNGSAVDVPEDTSIAQMLEIAEIRSQLVAVEVNLEIVPKAEHTSHRLAEGDIIEAVTLVGGG